MMCWIISTRSMRAFMPETPMPTMDYIGTLYRSLNPLWAAKPLCGEGAARFGGRFNPKGMAALYTSPQPEAAMREANQAGAFQPMRLVAYRAEIRNIFDATDPACLDRIGMSAVQLAALDWRDVMMIGHVAPTQRLAIDLSARNYAGILAPSFAAHARQGDCNLVLWRWGDTPPALLQAVNDQAGLCADC